ncbi:MAG: 8-oxo-dGTP diphosphatase [Parcubacteria bacterium C7867-001]|nr:MAG: 8-oxo-dGTP diphosphatase [Parcubacteria bacterium C7867-001]
MKIIYCADIIAHWNGLPNAFVVVERLGSVKGLAFPGGKQEDGELLSATAVRELAEETGLAFAPLGVLGTYAVDGRDPRGHYISTTFIGNASGTIRNEAGKTCTVILSKDLIIARKDEFVFDHFKMFTDYLARGGFHGSHQEGPQAAGLV